MPKASSDTRAVWLSPLGPLVLTARRGQLVAAAFGEMPESPASDPVLARAIQEFQEYFAGVRRHFSFPLQPCGTPFQERVWQELTTIPYGTVCTYGEIARRIGSPGAARAVGMACRANPIVIAIACHRVVGTGGLTGYAAGIGRKRALLMLESGRREMITEA